MSLQKKKAGTIIKNMLAAGYQASPCGTVAPHCRITLWHFPVALHRDWHDPHRRVVGRSTM